MKQFFKFFLACLFAIAAFIFLGFMFLFIIGASSSNKGPSVEDNSVLVWDLSTPCSDKDVSENPFAGFGDVAEQKAVSLHNVQRALKSAATDKKIKGLYLKLNPSTMGWASMQELKPAIEAFKKSGKFVWAYADAISQKSYFMATQADKIYTHPMGGIEWKGLSGSSIFFKNALAKLDIQPQVFYDGKYKGASEQFRLDKFSNENRYQISELMHDFYAELLQNVSKRTGIDTATLHTYTNQYTLKTASDAVRYKFVDGIKYEVDVLNDMKALLKVDAKDDLNKVTMSKYIQALSPEKIYKDRIAVLYADGEIVDGKNEDKVSTELMVKQIRKIAKDDKVKALVLRINSPGGSALASETMYYELMQLKKKMPIVVSMGDVAASGGYYLSCAGDSVFAQSNTITGSIGVVGMMLNFEGFMKNKLGITTDVVKTSDHADFPSATRSLSDFETKIIQEGVDSIYIQFKSRVSAARKLSMDQVEALAQGRVYSGQDALQVGLVDQLGGLDDAIQCAARKVKLNEYKLDFYPRPIDKFQSFIRSLQGDIDEQLIVKKYLGSDYATYQQLGSMKEKLNKNLCLLPYELVIQ